MFYWDETYASLVTFVIPSATIDITVSLTIMSITYDWMFIEIFDMKQWGRLMS